MKPKKAKNRDSYVWLAISCLALLCLFVAEPAHAYNFSTPTCGGSGFTRALVPCIKENFLTATNSYLIPFSNTVAQAVNAACVLAVIFWGAKMVAGTETAPLRDATITAIKIGFVITFTYNFGGDALDPNHEHGGSFGMMLDIMQDLLNYVSGFVILDSEDGLGAACDSFTEMDPSYLVWDAVDCSLESLIGGIFSGATITTGIIGFITACIFSNAIGFTIGIICLYIIYKIIFAIIKCVYIFISAYMGLAFLIVVSPLFIPTILFKPTKQYFERWLKLLTSFMIQPMMVFAYLSILLAAYDTVIYSGENSLFNTLSDGAYVGGNNMGIGEFLEDNGMYALIDKDSEAIAVNSRGLADAGLIPDGVEFNGAEGKVGSKFVDYVEHKQLGLMETLGVGGINPNFFEIAVTEQTLSWNKLALYNGFDSSTGGTSTLSFMLQVLVSAFMALATCYIFIDLLEAIPLIGAGIANYGKPGDAISATLANKKELTSGGGSGGFAGKFGLGI